MNCVDFLFFLTQASILPCLMFILLFGILQDIDGKSSRKKIMLGIWKNKKYRQVDTINPTAIKPKQNKTGKKKKRRPVNNLDKRWKLPVRQIKFIQCPDKHLFALPHNALSVFINYHLIMLASGNCQIKLR